MEFGANFSVFVQVMNPTSVRDEALRDPGLNVCDNNQASSLTPAPGYALFTNRSPRQTWSELTG